MLRMRILLVLTCVFSLWSAEHPKALPQHLVDAVTLALRDGSAFPAAVLAPDADVEQFEREVGREREVGLLDFANAKALAHCWFKAEPEREVDAMGFVSFQLHWAKGSSVAVVLLLLAGEGADLKIVEIDDVDFIGDPNADDIERGRSPLVDWLDAHGKALAMHTLRHDWQATRELLLADEAALTKAIITKEGADEELAGFTIPKGAVRDLLAGELVEGWLNDVLELEVQPTATAWYAGHAIDAVDGEGNTEAQIYLLLPEGPKPGLPAILEVELEGYAIDGVFLPDDLDVRLETP